MPTTTMSIAATVLYICLALFGIVTLGSQGFCSGYLHTYAIQVVVVSAVLALLRAVMLLYCIARLTPSNASESCATLYLFMFKYTFTDVVPLALHMMLSIVGIMTLVGPESCSGTVYYSFGVTSVVTNVFMMVVWVGYIVYCVYVG